MAEEEEDIARSSTARPGYPRGTSIIEADSLSPSISESIQNEIIRTQSVTESIFHFHKENGRTYHSYRAGSYHFPNDASEKERLDFQHLILHHAFQEKLYFAPLDTLNPTHILDIGTGTGQWAIEMGDRFPNALIEATDLSPIQPASVPANVQFIIDDAEQDDWLVPNNHYDYIHTRVMLGSFVDFKQIIKKGFQHTKPGGYMESQEPHFTPYCDDGTMPPDWPFKEWSDRMHEGSMTANRPLRIGNKLKRWYLEAGFVDVQERVLKAPLGRWPRDPGLKALGAWWLENHLMGLQGFTLGYFTRIFNWTPEQVEVYLINVRRSLQDRRVHAYHKLYVVWGRKPEEGEVISSTAAAATSEPDANQPPIINASSSSSGPDEPIPHETNSEGDEDDSNDDDEVYDDHDGHPTLFIE